MRGVHLGHARQLERSTRRHEEPSNGTATGDHHVNLFGHDLLALMTSHGYLLLFAIILLEESGVPLPVPGDLLLLFTGSLVARGVLAFVPAFVLLSLATLIGTSLLYTLAFRGGRPLLRRYGRWLRIREEKVDRAERWLGRRPLSGVALLRLTPGLRIYSTIVAGMLAVPRRRATISFVLSGMIWGGAWLTLGVLLGPGVDRVAHVIGRFDRLILPAIGVVAVTFALLWLGRRLYRHYLRDWIRTASLTNGRSARPRRPRLGSATISVAALALLLISPALVGTVHGIEEQADAAGGHSIVLTQAHRVSARNEH